MLRSLRFRLTLFYLVAALGLTALLGGGTYGLLTHYFQSATDLALEYKMAAEFRLRGLPLPSELAAAEQEWLQTDSRPSVFPTASPTQPAVVSFGDGEHDDDEDDHPAVVTAVPSDSDGESDDDRYNASLAPVFVLPSAGGTVSPGVPVFDDPVAVSAALAYGSDLRTVRLDSGARLRLLTYRTGGGAGDYLQVGRLLTDQDTLLRQYLAGLLLLGGAASLLVALISWWLAGRTIRPAQQAWDRQQQFVSNASHELRTPLTILRASADLALRDPGSSREQALRDIVAEVDYMNRLVDDLLLLSRLDARRLELESAPVPLADLLAETARRFAPLAEAGGVTLVLEAAAGSARGDRLRLRQVLLILLDNALRFTPAGGTIRLGALTRGRAVFMYVADSGTGIPAEHLPHIFERFYQVPGQSGAGRGNGLGLSIARALVEAQRGSIQAESGSEHGTRVWISLPAV